MKRIFDLTITTITLIAIFPIIIFIAALVRFCLGSPVLYKQQRPGLNGKSFRIYKFRTMTDEKDDKGDLLPDEERLTYFGRFLRKTSLDELPELVNVLKGQMSIVGPRPLLVQYLDRYTLDQSRRHDVRPGITGWAQINGRNAISWEDKFKLDVWYVDNWSIWLDIKIVLLTIVKVIRREGIDSRDGAIMCEFMGTKRDTTNIHQFP